MVSSIIFVNRRKGRDRRSIPANDKESTAIYTDGKRRTTNERRDTTRSLTDDYYASMQKTLESLQNRYDNKT